MGKNQIEAFLEMMVAERGASANTIQAYQRDLTDLNGFLSAKSISLQKAKLPDLENYLHSVAKQMMSPKTQARRLSAIHEFYRFLYSEDIIKKNPADYLQAPKTGKSLPKYLTEKEINALIDVAEQTNKRMYVLLEILYASGMRVSELVGLPLQSVTRDNQTITIIGKGNKERIVPLNKSAQKALDNWLFQRELSLKRGRTSKWLFPSTGKSGHLTRDGFFKKLLVLIGLVPEDAMLLYNQWAVLAVMIYTYLPFAILPIYASAEKFDFSLMDAALDLGASPWQSFHKVFLPGISKGISAAVMVVLIPAFGAYLIPDLVGGPGSELLGDKIAQRVFTERNLPHASALSAILMLVVFLPLLLWFWLKRFQKNNGEDGKLVGSFMLKQEGPES